MRTTQTREAWFAQKFGWLKRGALAALVGVIIGVPLMLTKIQALSVVGGLILMFGVIWLLGALTLIPILHWKDRYRGERSTIWAIFLVFETSGWSKIFYWFMHVLPDRKTSGRYANENIEN